jgi:hypothetical protein
LVLPDPLFETMRRRALYRLPTRNKNGTRRIAPRCRRMTPFPASLSIAAMVRIAQDMARGASYTVRTRRESRSK